MSDSALELVFHLVDGRCPRYAQGDSAQAARIIQDARQRRLFDAPLISLAGDFTLTGLATRSVMKIDFMTTSIPDWPHGEGIDRIIQIDAEAFETGAQLGTDEARSRKRPHEVGELALDYMRFDLIGGRTDYFEVHSTIGAILDERRFLAHMWSAPLQAELPGVGFTLFNPLSIERVTIAPGPPEAPSDAWHVHFVSEKAPMSENRC